MQIKKQQLEMDIEQQTGSKLGKEYVKAVYYHPASHDTEYIMRNAGLEEAQAGIKIAGRNINNLRYADDTTLMAESEELKSLLMKVKEENENFGLKLNIHKTKIIGSSLITFYNKCDVICISELIDISPSILDSCLRFFQPSVSHDVLCI